MIQRFTARLLIALLLLACLPRPAAAQTIADPDLFEKSLEVAEEAQEQYGRYDNPEELARINRIGYELVQHSDFQKFPFTFSLVDLPVPNAFALPGGQIFITRGMLDIGLSDDMVANLLGHEIGHVTLEHYRRMQRKATLLSVLGNVLLAGILIGGANSGGGRGSGPEAPYDPRVGYDYGGDLVQGAAAASLILSELLLRSYSRDHEDESDEEGQRLAAAAGYDPDGARQLWALMTSRAPQAKEYGYWQTHPFQAERERSAEARKTTWKVQPRKSADDYRQRTQAVLLGYLERRPAPKKPERAEGRTPPSRPRSGPPGPLSGPDREEISFLKAAALATWPQGKSADDLRLERLHGLRDRELTKPLLSRDYGKVVRAYQDQRDAVRGIDAESPLLKLLDTELADFDVKRKELAPRAVEVLQSGVYETNFLESYLSNFPEAPEVPKVALALGDAYSRLGNESEAVEQYLAAVAAGPASAEGKRALAGLRNLAPSLQELAALQQLADQEKDAELQKIAAERLATMARSYTDVANGAEYLRRFPEGAHVAQIIDRLNILADNLYGEVVLYQGVGDSLKAMERINKILTHAPLSPAAEKLRDRAVVQDDRQG
jgi:predicted Zn-dependent protease